MTVSGQVATQSHHHLRRYRLYPYAIDVAASANHTERNR